MALALLLAILTLPLTYEASQGKTVSSKADSTKTAQQQQGSLLEIGRGTRISSRPKAAAEIKVISYNIRWRGGDDLRALIKYFREDSEIGDPAILGLQEVDRQKKRTGRINTVKLMAEELGMYYAWTAPPVKPSEEEETGVAILSAYPMSDIKRIVLPHEGPHGRRRVALGATISIGGLSVRVYSVHGETRIPVELKMEQLKSVIEDLQRFTPTMPAIILGDFNTWEASAVTKTQKLFSASGFQTPFDDQPTFWRRVLFVPIELKLDWIWLRGLDVAGAGIQKRISLSDHWPLWCVIRTPRPSTATSH